MYAFGRATIPPTQVFFRSALSVAFVNISPVLAGHVLVAPLRSGIARVASLQPDEAADLFTTSQRVGRVAERFFGATALTFIIQDGADAGQTIFQAHMHVIPRRKGDLAGDEIYDRVEKWTHEVDVRARRPADVMEREATQLRQAMREQIVLDRAADLLRAHFAEHAVDEGHGIAHALCVLQNCTRAMYAERAPWSDAQRMAVMLAALLHDADDRKFFGGGGAPNHARRIAAAALDADATAEWSGAASAAAVVDLVAHMIELVSASKNKNGTGAEPWMLFPRYADRLEAIGWVGVVRCYQYNRHSGAPLFTPATPRVTNETELAAVAPLARFHSYDGNSASMIDHYYDKLVHCADGFPDNAWFQREVAARRKTMLDFLFEFGRTGTVDETKLQE